MSAFHLAQLNTARLRAPVDDPSIAEFVAGVALMNALADRSPGFVWRLAEGESGYDATFEVPGLPGTILTYSLWESVEDLRAYVYQSAHLDYLRRRRDWFVPHEHRESMVLWWTPAGRIPPVAEGLARLERLRAEGATPAAFTFRRLFPAPVLEPTVP
ncbi:DUF3291 domain-containing protein [Symbioplanes lichenis]|uniref:DUF3291 domain-containing protein n=1 Tax=Symbioplanes lichenis TaxID=1629072 RepID=UPI002739F3CE|nr:DUF3291 domain-containing protein [Actinoplanes lichenis]